MIDTLRFVQGAVAKKDFVPTLTHFNLRGGKVIGFNGAIALCSPIECNLECSPRAIPFVKAIQTCRESVSLDLLKNGRLSVKAGRFQVYIDCTPEPYPDVKPEGEIIDIPPGLVEAFEELAPFIAKDASREWARGILFRGYSALATNNVVVVEKWLTRNFLQHEVNVPEEAVLELVRIGEDPIQIQTDGRSITFHFKGGRWLRSQLLSTEWPDVTKVWKDVDAQPIPEGLFQALEDLLPFLDDLGRVYLSPGKISTTTAEELGAVVGLDTINVTGIFNAAQLLLLKDLATKLDLSTYPAPCPFYGKGLRGMLIGMSV